MSCFLSLLLIDASLSLAQISTEAYVTLPQNLLKNIEIPYSTVSVVMIDKLVSNKEFLMQR